MTESEDIFMLKHAQLQREYDELIRENIRLHKEVTRTLSAHKGILEEYNELYTRNGVILDTALHMMDFCEKHTLEAKVMPFNEFAERDKKVGCRWCLMEETK